MAIENNINIDVESIEKESSILEQKIREDILDFFHEHSYVESVTVIFEGINDDDYILEDSNIEIIVAPHFTVSRTDDLENINDFIQQHLLLNHN